jgi:hypothetical protein
LPGIPAARLLWCAKQFSSLKFALTATAIPMQPARPNVTQSMSETPDLPEPYCVKQNTKHPWCTDVIAAQQGCSDGDRDMGL